MRFVSDGDMICIFMHAKREVSENSVAREWPRSRFWSMSLFLEKVHFAREFSMKMNSSLACFHLCSEIVQQRGISHCDCIVTIISATEEVCAPFIHAWVSQS